MLGSVAFKMARAWALAGVVALAAGCAGGGGAFTVAPQAGHGFSEAGLARLDQAMAKVVEDGHVVGMTTLLARNGKVAQFETYGLQSRETGAAMREDTIFRIYSMTKPITGVAMMMLYEEGKWDLDDPITKHIPEFANLQVLGGTNEDGSLKLEPPKRPATMRELMSHTAGFAYGLYGQDAANAAFREQRVLAAPDLQTMIDKIAAIPLLYQPGEQWFYSAAVDIQGYVVEKLSGQKFSEFLRQRLFDPLGMVDTSFSVAAEDLDRYADLYIFDQEKNALVRVDRPEADFSAPLNRLESGGGGLVGTTADYARFCQMLLNGGTLDGVRYLKPETVALMRTNVLPTDLGMFSDGTLSGRGVTGQGFGLDFGIVIDPQAANSPQGLGSYYWGGAAGTWFWIDPVNNLFFVGMIQRAAVNGSRGPVDFRALSIEHVYGALEP